MSAAELVAKLAKKHGDIQWDVYSQDLVETEIHLRNKEIESIRSPVQAKGFAVRVISKKEEKDLCGIGIAPGVSSDDLSEVERAFNLALESSMITNFPEYDLPTPSKNYSSVKISDAKITGNDAALAKDLGEHVLSLLSKERGVRLTFCKLRMYWMGTNLQNCNGVELSKSETFCYFEAGLCSGSGDSMAEYWPKVLGRRISDLDLDANIPVWAKYARDGLSAEQPETGRYDVILPPHVLADIVPPVTSFHASASILRRGLTKFKREEKVWNDAVTIYDDGLVDYGVLTSSFDDEGTPQRRTEIIYRGIFKNFLCDRMYAKFAGGQTTGNALKDDRSRGELCYTNDVRLGSTNTVMEGGDYSLDDLIKETKRGVLMEQFAWMVPDDITGSFGAEIRNAYLIEDGELKGPLKGGQVNGSLFDTVDESGKVEPSALKSVDMITKERKLVSSSLLPTVRFPNLKVSGR